MKNRYKPIEMQSPKIFQGIGKRTLSERLPGLIKNERTSSFITGHKNSYMKFFESFEKMCDNYEEIPDIKFEDEIDKDKEKTTPKHKKIIKDEKMSYIIKQLKHRIKNSPIRKAVCIKLDRFKTQNNTEEHVGPGSYSIIIPSNSESHEFSTIPRLKTPISHNIYLIQAALPKKLSNKSCIWRNKNFVGNSEIIREKRQSLNFIKKSRVIEVRMARESLDQHNREEKLKKINQKTILFEKRMKERNRFRVQKSWILLITLLSFSSVINIKIAMFYRNLEAMIK
ncbi:hypothetical protein SteCoe_35368 [Stentor coeruleus]|uniref:Uncharacterized protein n=1 Tax=Stentor coeruleus TaxID=5963 RepID=A0A1R2ASE9_9CILI|nr:hypothetical protein SteCoe_35368 [Stentor coeruleus]